MKEFEDQLFAVSVLGSPSFWNMCFLKGLAAVPLTFLHRPPSLPPDCWFLDGGFVPPISFAYVNDNPQEVIVRQKGIGLFRSIKSLYYRNQL